MKREVSRTQPAVRVTRLARSILGPSQKTYEGPTVRLANGVEMPQVGFGTAFFPEGRREPELIWEALPAALDAGFRHIDTAHMYGNERHIGDMLGRRFEDGRLCRSDVFLTTKVAHPPVGLRPEPSDGETAYMLDPAVHAGAGLAKQFEGCLRRLGLGYVDLLLVHWPGPYNGKEAAWNKRKRIQMWEAMEEIFENKLARAIGVSNFTKAHLEEILAGCRVKPHINQIEMHPLLTQRELRSFCREHGIVLTAYSPLAGGKVSSLIQEPAIAETAAALKVTPAQVVLKWLMQEGIVVIPRSSSAARMQENLSTASLPDLSAEQLGRIEGLDEGLHTCSDPNEIA